MIEFPQFKKLELSDRSFIESFTKDYLPYSDYNFTSLWSWNIKDEIQFSTLNGNLIVRFTDYITSKPFYSFLGSSEQEKTIDELLQLCIREGLEPTLKLLPAESVRGLSSEKYTIVEDEDNFDYILLIPLLCEYPGKHFRGKKNFVNRFRKNYIAETVILDMHQKDIQDNMKQLFFTWADNKELSVQDTKNEYEAITRLLKTLTDTNLISIGLYVDKRLIGFSVNEIVNGTYAILHFEKADSINFVGIYPYVMQETARVLAHKECMYLNYEQDLGIEGLKKSKLSYSPAEFLKKFRLQMK